MREIKFKSYVKKEGKIESIIWCPFNEDRSSPDFDSPVKGDLLAYGLQFTGLKDKNGKEIYEGDILCWPEYEGKKHQSRWVIEWDDEKAEYTKWHPKNKAEVIGNIYENPELVTPK